MINSVQEIERAIGTLSPPELEELYLWLDQHYPNPIDVRLSSDIDAGHLDEAVRRALDDEENGRAQPL